MAISIPALAWASAAPEFVDAGVDQVPALGAGVRQRLERLGSHWALTVTYPPIREGAAWQAVFPSLVLARSQGASYPFPQPAIVIQPPVSGLLVNGNGQTGSALNVQNVNPADQVKRGQFVSVTAAGRKYLYMVAADMAAPSGSLSALSLYPPLRASPPTGSAIEVVAPAIEGSITRDSFRWTHSVHNRIPLSFTIEEIA